MKKRLLSASVTLGMLAAAGSAQAFESFNARTMGVADAGVAVTHFTHGALLNPANVVRAAENDDFNINLNGGVLFDDEDELVDAVDDLSTTLDRADLDVLDAADNPDTLRDVRNQIAALSGKEATISGGANITIGIPGEMVSGVFFVNVVGGFGVSPTVASADLAQIDSLIQKIDDGTATAADDIDTNTLQSSVMTSGMVMTEIGIALGKEFSVKGYPIAVGITPKLQRADTFIYSETIDDADSDDFDADQYLHDDSGFNLDLGATIHRDNWYVGLTGRNLIKQEFETIVANRTVDVEPQFTAGVGFDHDWGRVLLDADLNPAAFVGTNRDTQFVKFGAELNIYRAVQFRVGYRHDLEGSLEDTITAGFGISPFEVVNLDIAAMKGGDNTYGLAMQLGILF